MKVMVSCPWILTKTSGKMCIEQAYQFMTEKQRALIEAKIQACKAQLSRHRTAMNAAKKSPCPKAKQAALLPQSHHKPVVAPEQRGINLPTKDDELLYKKVSSNILVTFMSNTVTERRMNCIFDTYESVKEVIFANAHLMRLISSKRPSLEIYGSSVNSLA